MDNVRWITTMTMTVNTVNVAKEVGDGEVPVEKVSLQVNLLSTL